MSIAFIIRQYTNVPFTLHYISVFIFSWELREIYCLVNCCSEGTMHGAYEPAAAAAVAMAPSTYPLSVHGTAPESRPKSEGFFGWLPGGGIMNKVIEKTKVIISLHSFVARSSVLYGLFFSYLNQLL